jgi:DnaJ-class molecular chaperone
MICPDCGGRGARYRRQACANCDGTGWRTVEEPAGFENSRIIRRSEPCPICATRGGPIQEVYEGFCPTCNRTGQVKAIPAVILCPKCFGRKVMRVPAPGFYPSGMPKFQELTCDQCHGAGNVHGYRYEPDYR